MREIRITYTDRRGAGCMRRVEPAKLESTMRSLYRRGLTALAYWYDSATGERVGEAIGEVRESVDKHGLVWWCDSNPEEQ